MRKLTIEFIKEQFEKEGYILLSKIYVDSGQKLNYVCPEGHKESITWDNWRQGHRCSVCANCKKYTIEFIRKHFEREGYILLSKIYINNKQSLEYRCSKGHFGTIQWANWSQGKRCAECGGTKKLVISFIRKQFEREGYMLLTNKYGDSKNKLEYVCPKKHNGSITWDSWRQGNRCNKCATLNMIGANHPRWNLSLTDEDREDRRLISGYKRWAYAVKEHDNFTCQICGDNRGGNLISHHIESYDDNPDLRIALDNGVCLCEKCHKKFHSMYGYGNNTRKQFEKFIGAEV